MSNETAYDKNLQHIAEPASPREREATVSATLESFEALWVARVLREHAHYGRHSHDDEASIAIGYADYINTKIRDLGKEYVSLYAHTDAAIETLVNAILEEKERDGAEQDFPIGIYQRVEDEFAEAFINGEMGDE